jgi:hypothetical protein
MSSIHLPWRASAACLGAEASTQRAAQDRETHGQPQNTFAHAGYLRFPGENQFDGLECRDLLDAGRPGRHFGLLHCTLV